MDLIKTIMVYMMMVVSSATENAPAVTAPPPEALVTPPPIVTMAPTLVPTAVPTPTPVPYTTLYVGDRGEAVKKLQRRLTELGYLNDVIDGVYGQNTKKAVERFQYYNGLKVDGIAGRATQTVLFESYHVVLAPPNVTPAPTLAPTMPASAVVPVYYVDEAGRLISRVNMTCYGSTTIYANSNQVSSDYTLISSNAVMVNIVGGQPSPASVTFRYQKKAAPTAAVPSRVTIPVYYRTQDGRTLYQTTATLNTNAANRVVVSPSLVASHYQLTSASVVTVQVDAYGIANPNAVIFTFRDASTPAPTQAPVYQAVTVYYLTEDGAELTRETRQVQRNSIATLYPNSALVPVGYTLVSQNALQVQVDAYGNQQPEMIYFRYAAPAAPTAVPTQKPPAYAYITVILQEAQTGEMVHSYQTQVSAGKSTTLYADYSGLPAGYTPSGDSQLTVYVDKYGVPAYQPVFYCTGPAPTQAPPATAYITVLVQDAESGELLYSYQTLAETGKSVTLYADYSGLSAQYAPSGDSQLTVYVDEYGVPAYQPVFYGMKLATPVPTAEPTPEPPATAYLVIPFQDAETGMMVHSYEIQVFCGMDNVIHADYSGLPEGYMPQGDHFVKVYVDEKGQPSGQPVFYCVKKADPTQAPSPVPAETPAPTEIPAPTEVPAAPAVQLTHAGAFVSVRGEVQEMDWYLDGEGLPLVRLKVLSHACGWQYQPGGQSLLADKEAWIEFDEKGVIRLEVAGQDLAGTALVWDYDLFVGEKFLDAMDLIIRMEGDMLFIDAR